jgi:hypothetical protein
VLVDMVDLDDVGVVELGDGLGLGQEAGGGFAAGVGACQDHLEGDGAVEPDLAGLVDHAHAAAPQLVHDLVSRDGRGSAVDALPRGVTGAGHGVRVGRRAEARLGRQSGAEVAGAGLGPYRPRDRCASIAGHGDRGRIGRAEARCGRGRSTELRDRAVEVSAGHGSAARVENGCIGFAGDRSAIGTGRGRGRSGMVGTRGVRVGWVGHRELPGHDTKIRSFMPRSTRVPDPRPW